MSRDLASFLRILAASIYTADSSGLKSRNFGFAEVAGELARSERFLAAKSVLEPETVRQCWWRGLDYNSRIEIGGFPLILDMPWLGVCDSRMLQNQGPQSGLWQLIVALTVLQ